MTLPANHAARSHPAPPPRSTSPGVTLIEILAVLAVIAVLASLAVPAFDSLTRGSRLTQAAQLLSDHFALARQTALTTNRQVEVRFLKYSDPTIPGENPADPNSGKFRAIQLFQTSESGTTLQAIGKIQRFPGPTVIVDGGNTLSSIIGGATASPAVPSLANGTALGVPIPRVGLNYSSVAFRFMPDGSTNLPPQTVGQRWFVTLHETFPGDNLAAPPPNFVTVQINPSNGKVRTYHP